MVYTEITVLLVVVMAVMLLGIVYTALHRKGWLEVVDILLPELRGLDARSEIASIIVHPLFWIVSVAIIAFFTISLLFSVNQTGIGYEWLVFSFAVVIFFALFDPLVIWFSEGKYHEPLRFVFGAMSYGAVCALFAFFINSMANIWLNIEFGERMGLLLLIATAPIVEEALKMVGVVLIAGHKNFKGPLDGILIGFSVGTGFAMMENIFYAATKIPENSIELLVFRALYNTLAHGAFTAIGGAVLGKIREVGKVHWVVRIMVPFFVAALTHTAFNVLAIVDIIGVNSLVLQYYIFSPMMVVALMLIITILIFYNWWDRKKRISKELEALGVGIDFDKEFRKLKEKQDIQKTGNKK
ncbi:MAG: PrsW family intramembrane metalloprotease [Candidatus Micrarchaeia archaeon]